MQSHQHVQQVWDSFVTHLKGLSESLQTAYEVFSQPEEEIKAGSASVCALLSHRAAASVGSDSKHRTAQGMSLTTLKRRKHKSLESLSKGKENVDRLLMQASQVYSATSHWQSVIDTADAAKQEALMMLASVKDDLQVHQLCMSRRTLRCTA